MYYKSNIELNYLFFTNTKCHNFLFQVNNFIKNNSKKIREFSRPVPIPSRPDRDGTRDENSVPSLFRDGTWDGDVPILSRPMNTPNVATSLINLLFN